MRDAAFRPASGDRNAGVRRRRNPAYECWYSSRQAVRGAGPHEGVVAGRLFPAPQRGYESA
jgi:hypothetical protein